MFAPSSLFSGARTRVVFGGHPWFLFHSELCYCLGGVAFAERWLGVPEGNLFGSTSEYPTIRELVGSVNATAVFMLYVS